MPPEAYALLEQLVARWPLPQGSPGAAQEDACRAWTRRAAEQLRYSLGPTWGHKSADPYRPPSKDVVAFQTAAVFWGWDTMAGAGTGSPTFNPYPPPDHNLAGQYFITVEPINHLEEEPPTPPPDGDLEQRVAALELEVADLQQRFRKIAAAAAGA